MRCFSLWLLASALLGGVPVARADDPTPVVVKDGITVSAVGRAGEFDRHMLTIYHDFTGPAERVRVVNRLKELGLAGVLNDDQSNCIVRLPDGACDGTKLGKVTRGALLDALDELGIAATVQLLSSSSMACRENNEKRALSEAVRAARSKAEAMAKAGGGKLGKLLGADQTVDSGEMTPRILKLDRAGTHLLSDGGATARVTARFQLK